MAYATGTLHGIEKRLGWEFGIDLAAEEHNALCDVYITPECDSLSTDWFMFAEMFGVADKAGWLNPPFSNVAPWVEAVKRSQLPRIAIMVNSATDTVWWHDMADAASQVWILKGRVSFVSNESGKRVNGNNHGQSVFIFDTTRNYDQKIITVNTKCITL